MEMKNPATIVPPEIWTKIFELLTVLKPDYSKNLYTNDNLNCYHVCVTFRNILKPTIISSLFPQILPFIHPYVANNSIKPLLNCRLVCKAWNQGVDHFLETHDIFTRKQLQDGKVFTNYLITSSPSKSIPMTCLFTDLDISFFLREMSNGNEGPFVGNSLRLRYEAFENQTGSSNISISSVQELLTRFGRYVKVLYLYIFQYQNLERFWRTYPYRTFYDQLRNILEHTPNLQKLSIQGYLDIDTRRIWMERLDFMLDEEVAMLSLPVLNSVEIDIGGRHSYGLKLAIQLGICTSSFSQLKRLSLSSILYADFYPQRKHDIKVWSRASGCLPNLEQLEVRIVTLSNLKGVFHLASKSTKLGCLVIKIATHSWKDHVKYFCRYYPYNDDPFYRSMCASAHERECSDFRACDLGNLLRTVQIVFWKSLETLVIFVEEIARKFCKASQHDLEILKELPHLRNLHIEGFPLCKLEIIGKLPSTLKSLTLNGFSRAFNFDIIFKTKKFKMMPGVSSDLKDGWTIYQSEIWEQLPELQRISVVLWDHKIEDYTVYIYRRGTRDCLLTTNEETRDQENCIVDKSSCRENKICCSFV